MERRAEPDLMDEHEQAHAYANADFEEPHEHFVTLFKQCFPDTEIDGLILDLGCGAADISIRFARHYPQCRVYGVDGAQAMLDCGMEAVKAADLERRIKLAKVYLPDEQPKFQAYQAIISNSLLHHLKNPLDIWQVMTNIGRQGTRIFVMDLMRPESEQQAKDIVATYAADEPVILQRDFYYSLLSSYTIEEVKRQLTAMGLLQFNIQAVSDRHMIIWTQL